MTKITESRHLRRPPPMPRKDEAIQQRPRGQLDLEQFYRQSEVRTNMMKNKRRFGVMFEEQRNLQRNECYFL